MTVLLEDTNQVDFFTDLSKVIIPFKDYFRKLNWLLTDLDYIIHDSDKYGNVDKLDHEEKIISYSGEDLLKIIETREIQFVWGVIMDPIFRTAKRRYYVNLSTFLFGFYFFFSKVLNIC